MPPDDMRSGPHRQERAATATTNNPILRGGDDTPEQLRRRRAASWRLPPTPSGQRDPLDGLAGMPVGVDRRCTCVSLGVAELLWLGQHGYFCEVGACARAKAAAA